MKKRIEDEVYQLYLNTNDGEFTTKEYTDTFGYSRETAYKRLHGAVRDGILSTGSSVKADAFGRKHRYYVWIPVMKDETECSKQQSNTSQPTASTCTSTKTKKATYSGS